MFLSLPDFQFAVERTPLCRGDSICNTRVRLVLLANVFGLQPLRHRLILSRRGALSVGGRMVEKSEVTGGQSLSMPVLPGFPREIS